MSTMRVIRQTVKKTPYRETDALTREKPDGLEEQKARFLAGGGKIEEIPIGVSADRFVDRRTANELKAKRVLGGKRGSAARKARYDDSQ